MQTILVPVDFSKASRNASEYAAQLARVLKAKLVLFHAYMLPTPVSEVPYAMVTVEDLQQENEEHIKKEAAFLHGQYELEVEWLVRIGIPSDEIKVLASEKDALLVVMGIKGAGGLDKIIGSTTINVIRKTKMPVLVIPADSVFTPIRHITYASDFSYYKIRKVFSFLLEIAREFRSKLHIVHVQKEAGSQPADSAGEEPIFEGYDHEFITVHNPSVTNGINQYLNEHSSDMLVMVAHKHSFLERIFSKTYTTAMAYETKIPLLVLKQNA